MGMASASSPVLSSAIEAVASAFDKLEAAVTYAAAERDSSAGLRETVQAEITAGWELHSAKTEAALAEAQAENSYLKEDNQRLSNQLQQLQQEYLDLQTTANSTLSRLDGSVRQLDLILERA
jgi:chromosome segregation ATPase